MSDNWNTDCDISAEDETPRFDDTSDREQILFSVDYDSDLETAEPVVDAKVNPKKNETPVIAKAAPNKQVAAREVLQSKRSNRERVTMSDFDNAIAGAVSNIPECLAAGVVDMGSGMLIGVKTVDSHPQEVLDMLSAATQDLFQGPNVVTIENIFKKSRGLAMDDFHYFKEIIVNSENLIHVFIRGKQNPEYVMTFVCRLSANLGMVLTKARAQVPLVEAAI